ncbi:hypothetical protein JG687_00011375 [Phytophthora cactorum]|uniref:Homeodomain-like n=1 Tax=Phytophthora cactorum TaxID=29920 RepID=A0A8T1U8M3_9STRA|nr:hypothetical protein JG687_00011375 [Phytophthora cactorum]
MWSWPKGFAHGSAPKILARRRRAANSLEVAWLRCLLLNSFHFATFFLLKMPSLYNRYSLQIKLRILEAARSGGDWELIAETNNVNINTARSWLHCYPKTSDVLHPRPRGGKQQQKMMTDAVTYLLSELSIDPDLTLIQLADKFDTQCAISVCPQTITHHLDGNLIIMKQFHKEPQYMNAEVNKFKRRESLIHFAPRVATAQLCASCYRHTLTFHVKVTDLEDIPVGR